MTSSLDTGNYLVPVHFHQGKRLVEESLLALDPLSHVAQPSLRGSFAAERARLTALRIGDIEVADKMVEYPSDDHSQFPPILGMDTLAGYRVLLDFPSKRMYIQYAVPSVNIKLAESIKPAEAKATSP